MAKVVEACVQDHAVGAVVESEFGREHVCHILENAVASAHANLAVCVYVCVCVCVGSGGFLSFKK